MTHDENCSVRIARVVAAGMSGETAFLVAPSKVEGCGISALTDLPQGTVLHLLHGEGPEVREDAQPGDPDYLPDELLKYCFRRGDGKLHQPVSFNALECGYFMNHSDTPNVGWDDSLGEWVALQDIKKGDELFFDYGPDKGF